MNIDYSQSIYLIYLYANYPPKKFIMNSDDVFSAVDWMMIVGRQILFAGYSSCMM